MEHYDTVCMYDTNPIRVYLLQFVQKQCKNYFLYACRCMQRPLCTIIQCMVDECSVFTCFVEAVATQMRT